MPTIFRSDGRQKCLLRERKGKDSQYPLRWTIKNWRQQSYHVYVEALTVATRPKKNNVYFNKPNDNDGSKAEELSHLADCAASCQMNSFYTFLKMRNNNIWHPPVGSVVCNHRHILQCLLRIFKPRKSMSITALHCLSLQHDYDSLHDSSRQCEDKNVLRMLYTCLLVTIVVYYHKLSSLCFAMQFSGLFQSQIDDENSIKRLESTSHTQVKWVQKKESDTFLGFEPTASSAAFPSTPDTLLPTSFPGTWFSCGFWEGTL